MRFVLIASTVMFLAVGAGYCQNSQPGRLRAGAAKADITPKTSELEVSTDSIRDHLFVRAIVVEDGSSCAVLVGMDLGGAQNQIVDDATPRVSQATGCPAQNFVISATHTHSSNTQGLGGRGAPTAKTVADAIAGRGETSLLGAAGDQEEVWPKIGNSPPSR